MRVVVAQEVRGRTGLCLSLLWREGGREREKTYECAGYRHSFSPLLHTAQFPSPPCSRSFPSFSLSQPALSFSEDSID